MIVGYHNGLAVHLSDVANVQDSAQSIRTAGYLNGIPSVTVIIFRQPGANIIQTNDRIRAQLPFLQAVMPQGIKTTIVLDRTTTIKASLHDVESLADHLRRPGHPGGLCLPAQRPRHPDSQRRRARSR